MDIQPYQFKSVTHDKPLPTVKAVIQSTKDNANNVSRAIQKPVKDAYKAVDNAVKGSAQKAVDTAKGIGNDISKNVANSTKSLEDSANGAVASLKTGLSKWLGILGKDFLWVFYVLIAVAIIFVFRFLGDLFKK
jgi:phage-related tail protein